MKEKNDVWQGTLSLMVLKSLEVMGPLHGYGVARRIEQTSGDLLSINHGTLLPGSAEAGTGGCDRFEVGRLRQQPQGEVLSDYEGGVPPA